MAMVRTNINLDENQYATLAAIRESRGHSLSELIRAAVDQYLPRVKDAYVPGQPSRPNFLAAAGAATPCGPAR